MTTATKISIAPDSALVIDPQSLGITATGRELEKLFIEFCNRNSESPWRFELSPQGEIIIMPPVHHPSDGHEHDLGIELGLWARDFGGVARGSSAAFQMPATGGALSPDASWTTQERWDSHPHLAGDSHPLCPDFVVEIRSTYDNLAPLHAKMQLYMRNGALLGWLIDARNRRVHIYRAGRTEPELLEDPATLSGEDVMPGFTFDVARWIFDHA